MNHAQRDNRWRPSALARVLAAMVLVALLAAAGLLWWGRGKRPASWLETAVTRPVFVVWMLVAVGSAVALAVLVGLMVRLGAGRKPAAADGEEGSAMVEFAIVLPFALMLALVMAQAALLMAGHICVHYASFAVARSALVTVPENLSPIEPPNYVVPDSTSSAKLQRLHLAAVWAVLPVSCHSIDIPEGDAVDLKSGLRGLFAKYGETVPEWAQSLVGRKLYYADAYTSVTLEPPELDDYYYPHEDLRVHVKHTFYMALPFAGKLFANMSGEDGVPLSFAPGEYGIIMRASCQMPNEGIPDWIEPEKFPAPGEEGFEEMYGTGR